MNRIFPIIIVLGLIFPAFAAASVLDHDSLFTVINESDNDSIKVTALISLAMDMDDEYPDSAFILLEKAERIALRNKNAHQLSFIHLEEGRIFYEMNEYAEAIQFLFEAKNDVEQEEQFFNDSILRRRYVNVMNYLGLIYFNIEKFEESLEYLNSSIRFMTENHMSPENDSYREMYLKSYINIGAVNIRTGKYTEAEINYTKALTMLDDTDLLSYAVILNNLGIIAKEQEDFNKAFDYHQRALKIRKENQNYLGLVQTYNNIAATYFVAGDYESAMPKLEQSLEISREHGFLNSAVISLFYLIEISESRNDYYRAYQYQSEYIVLNDSLMNQEKLRVIAQMEMQDKFDSRVREALVRQEKMELEQRKKEIVYVLITAAAVLGLLVLVLFYFLQRGKMKRHILETRQNNLEVKSLELEKQNLERELEFRTKELATNVMYMARTSEFITRISEKLLKSKMYFTRENQEVIHKIITELQTYVDQDTWADFEVRFQQVHNDFYTELNKLHPDLTANEKKLCAFLRLNMTTKEISAITYQSINSIVVARSRLRKKLGIDRDENLVAYLENMK